MERRTTHRGQQNAGERSNKSAGEWPNRTKQNRKKNSCGIRHAA